ncbi:hypothetical protein CWRG_02652 [Chthonomonas calidirosea]|uniref:hypothetical protein n=1 Tax=Chthonomonas calidirosea TaxID=454171 RepID=UPI0006DD4299|nr:hypothetical protein [Chthonomonas calidirosea]CEK19888.1 hypothetical protein CWRG_02652 [Chthonomonas calidirosea]
MFAQYHAFRCFLKGGMPTALLLLLGACHPPFTLFRPNSSPSSLPPSTSPWLLRVVPTNPAPGQPLVISQLGSRRLKPPLVLPPGSRIMGLYFSEGLYEGDISVEYVVSIRLSCQQAYAFYQRYYAKANVRWYGAHYDGSKLLDYAFALYPVHQPRKYAITFVIFPNGYANGYDSTEKLISSDALRQPVIYVGGEVSTKEIEEEPVEIPVRHP